MIMSIVSFIANILLVATSCIVKSVCKRVLSWQDKADTLHMYQKQMFSWYNHRFIHCISLAPIENIKMYYFFISSRYDQGRDNSQHNVYDYEDNPSRENEEVSSYYHGTLESSKNSGLSSSSYELSQYINGAEHNDPGPQPAHTSDAGEYTVKAVFSQVHFT